MKAYTYLIKDNINNKWYYGVRYARNCKTTDVLTTYFSSSKFLNAAIQKYGVVNFTSEIRREFETADAALNWEMKVLRRMKITKRPDCYNVGIPGKFPVYDENNNPPPISEETRQKLSAAAKGRKLSKEHIARSVKTQFKQKMIKWIKLWRNKTVDNTILGRSRIINNYLNYIKEYKPKSFRIITLLRSQLEFIANYQTERIRRAGVSLKFGDSQWYTSPDFQKRERFIDISLVPDGWIQGMKNTRRTNIKRYWYTSPDLTEMKQFDNLADVPKDWIKGMKEPNRNKKIGTWSKTQTMSDEVKHKLSEYAKRKLYYTSPDLMELRAFYKEEDAPPGWIRGNKLKSRCEKISTYLREVRHKKPITPEDN